jgi:hypothetical protein
MALSPTCVHLRPDCLQKRQKTITGTGTHTLLHSTDLADCVEEQLQVKLQTHVAPKLKCTLQRTPI